MAVETGTDASTRVTDDTEVERWARVLDPHLWRIVDGASTQFDPKTIEHARVGSLQRAQRAIALANEQIATHTARSP